MNNSERMEIRGGSLCSLSWDGKIFGEGVIVGFAPKFVYMWPAVEDLRAFAPGIQCRNNPHENSRNKLWVYPDLETPVGRYLLDECYGPAETIKRLQVIREQLGNGNLNGITRSDVNDIGKLEQLSETWHSAMDIDSPENPIGNCPFNPQIFKGYGIRQGTLAEDLGLQLSQVAALYTGRRIPTKEQVLKVSDIHNVKPESLLGPELPEANYLIQQRSKKNIQEICSKLAVTEQEARRSILDRLVLAARTTGSPYERIDAITREIVGRNAEFN